MKIAIIGAGFCGLAIAWHLANKGISPNQIVLFDAKGIGKGASGIAAGLLHPYAGLHAKKSWQADAGMKATKKLLTIAEEALDTSVVTCQGLIRLAVQESQKRDFSLAASLYSDVHELTNEACCHKLGYPIGHPGIFIDTALAIDCEKYLQGLWKACEKQGVVFWQKTITTLSELKEFDQTVIAMGAASKLLPELSHLPITPVKGQVLELAWPEDISPFAYPVSSLAYLLVQPGGRSCLAGASFEHHYETEGPELGVALELVMPKVQAFFPPMNASLVKECRAGMRASTPDHLPIARRIGDNCWVLAGMGSKGLLYHALYAERLAAEIIDYKN